jgi:predicted nucleotidyltransferase
MVNKDKLAVLKTLKYGDLFDCPQTKNEVKKFLIAEIKSNVFKKILTSSPEISFDSGYYFLRGREKIIDTKKKREKESLLKIEKTKKLSFWLYKIPSILLFGISGSVAAKNAESSDDIDIFVITNKNTLWATRLLMIIFLKFLGVYRGKQEKNVKNKFCLNMFLTDESMVFNKNRRNIYTAREICQLIPIFQRENTYSNFLIKNNWVKEYLPNAQSFLEEENKQITTVRQSLIGLFFMSLLETPARYLQVRKINKNLTNETIAYNFIAFHPRDVMKAVVDEYSKYPGVITTRGY